MDQSIALRPGATHATNHCRTCHEPDADNGEGYDGECGNCADVRYKADRKKPDDTEGGTCD